MSVLKFIPAAALAAALMCCNAAPAISADDGRLSGDDVIASGARCYMTADEIAADEAVWEAEENRLIEEALLARANKIENCRITHYCAEKRSHICGTGDGVTATGTKVVPGVTAAVDPRVIPLGSTIMIEQDGEIHYYVAADTGGAIKGNRIDLCVASHDEALKLGTMTATVFWADE